MNSNKQLAQPTIEDESGRLFIEGDWFKKPLPQNLYLDEMSYPDTSYSFATCFSKKPLGFSLGYASGNYGHSIFTTGENGQISVGKFVVLQATRIFCNLSVIIADHCMFSWGSVITDSWVADVTLSPVVRRRMLEKTSHSLNRHLEFEKPVPVIIEENVWVGFDAVVLPGVRIGRGAVVGCKTIISEDIPPYAVVVGNPARIIKYLQPTDTHEAKQEALKQFLI